MPAPLGVVLLAGPGMPRLAAALQTVRAALPEPLLAVAVTDRGAPALAAEALAARGAAADVLLQGPGPWGARVRLGLQEALRRGADPVAVLAADGRHEPAALRDLVRLLRQSPADVGGVVGSRLRSRRDAAALPLPRRLGARALAGVVRVLSGRRHSEFHAGPRVWRRAALERVDLDALPATGAFEVALLLALLERHLRVLEVPTRAGDAPPAPLLAEVTFATEALAASGRAALARARGRLAFAGPPDLPPSQAPSVRGARAPRPLPTVSAPPRT